MSGVRTFKSSPDSSAGIVAAKNVVRMHGAKENFVMTDEKGTTVSGPMSFVTGTDQLRFAGLWTMANQLRLTLPSTIATPTPVMVVNPPIRQFTALAKDASLFISLIATLSG